MFQQVGEDLWGSILAGQVPAVWSGEHLNAYLTLCFLPGHPSLRGHSRTLICGSSPTATCCQRPKAGTQSNEPKSAPFSFTSTCGCLELKDREHFEGFFYQHASEGKEVTCTNERTLKGWTPGSALIPAPCVVFTRSL